VKKRSLTFSLEKTPFDRTQVIEKVSGHLQVLIDRGKLDFYQLQICVAALVSPQVNIP
jgi:hypothetical protein